MGCRKSKEQLSHNQQQQQPRRRRPRLESVVPKHTDSTGFVLYSTPTEGYNISQGLQSYDSGENLGLLCLTSMKLIHQASNMARVEIPLVDIINVKSNLVQMNYMSYPNNNIISVKCRLDEDIVCINFTIDSPEKAREEIERCRKLCSTTNVNNNMLKRGSSGRVSKIFFKHDKS